MRAMGKIILFGEHSVVYGKPAIAVPVPTIYTDVKVSPNSSLVFDLKINLDNNETKRLHQLAGFVFRELNASPNGRISIDSTIPLGSGMGSSASLSVALIRAVAESRGSILDNEQVSQIAFKCEKIFHGNPSGIDNTVVTYEKPVFYIREKDIEFIRIRPLRLVIAGTGIKSSTKKIVEDVRKRYRGDANYKGYFDEMGRIAVSARDALEKGNIAELGNLMNKNHEYLQKIGVSCPELDKLVRTARENGALGAKLVGAGRGGNIVALLKEKTSVRGLEKKAKYVIEIEI